MGKIVKTIFGGGNDTHTVTPPPVPDYAAEQKKAEEESLKKRQATAERGMAATILGGSEGDTARLGKKQLLGE